MDNVDGELFPKLSVVDWQEVAVEKKPFGEGATSSMYVGEQIVKIKERMGVKLKENES